MSRLTGCCFSGDVESASPAGVASVGVAGVETTGLGFVAGRVEDVRLKVLESETDVA